MWWENYKEELAEAAAEAAAAATEEEKKKQKQKKQLLTISLAVENANPKKENAVKQENKNNLLNTFRKHI